MHLRTDMPRGGMISWLTRINSRMELITTMKSNLKTTTDIQMIQQWEDKSDLLNRETMYPDRPRAYIFSNISQVKRQTKKRFVYSCNTVAIRLTLAERWLLSSHLEIVKPGRLMVMLSGQNASVEEHQGHNQPEHPLRLANISALSSHRSVPPQNEL